jgi:vesicle coat complex subunit
MFLLCYSLKINAKKIVHVVAEEIRQHLKDENDRVRKQAIWINNWSFWIKNN